MLRAVSGLSRAQTAGLLIPGGVYRSGQRIGLPVAVGVVTATAIAADTMYAWPIPIAAPVLISQVAIQVGTAVVAVSGKLGLATTGSDGRPGALIAEGVAAVDMNSAAGTELTATFSAAQVVPPGVVWGLCVFNGAAQPITIGSLGVAAGMVGHYIGATSISNYTGNGTAGGAVRITRAHTYASAFPASLTGWSVTTGANPSSPVMVAVVA